MTDPFVFLYNSRAKACLIGLFHCCYTDASSTKRIYLKVWTPLLDSLSISLPVLWVWVLGFWRKVVQLIHACPVSTTNYTKAYTVLKSNVSLVYVTMKALKKHRWGHLNIWHPINKPLIYKRIHMTS